MTEYPYGKAALLILLLAIGTGVVHVALSMRGKAEKPDLVMAIFAPNHEEAYRAVLGDFEEQHGVRVQLQLVSQRALQSRLQSALLTGADVPDVVELLGGSMGYFSRGPLEDVGFVDLTDRLHEEGLFTRMVESRYSLWSSRGRIFAMPHDVHPVSLCYRRDLIAELGIDVDALKTWGDFVAMGQRVVQDLDGDGNPDRYALDTPLSSDWAIQILLLQRGGQLFDAQGRVAFDSDVMAETIEWYVRQTAGAARIGYEAGWGQSLAKAMNDGLVLFFFCPDWRTRQFEMDLPHLKGKLALMPLPAWELGGRRTSTWGGTGLAITKASKRPDLAWELAKFLYLSEHDLNERFRATNIVPPLKDAWNMPAFDEPREFFGGQAIGRLFADLAPETPPSYVSPYSKLAQTKITEVYLGAADYYGRSGGEELKTYISQALKTRAAYVRKVIARNAFLRDSEGETP
jgi:arabinosaccharide transport system substrate-binding protein